MVLAVDDFAAFVANWDSKPANVREIARQLSLPLDSFVFVDDNPAEREAIRQALPMVDVLALSAEPAEWRADLGRYPWLEPGAVTAEDRGRGDSYRARAAAAELEAGTESLEEFHRSLQMRAVLAPIDEMSFDRVVQLIAKTNQFNLTTRRHSAADMRRIVGDPAWVHVTARLEDRFADHGLVAVALAHRTGDVLDVDTLLMSCRVIGRTLESVLVEELVTIARSDGLRAVRGHYVPTERNGLVADLWTRHGFREVEDVGSGFTYELAVESHVPDSTHIAARRTS
jgi:FkbH-like protein